MDLKIGHGIHMTPGIYPKVNYNANINVLMTFIRYIKEYTVLTWERDEFDAPGQTPEPPHKQEGDGEQLGHAHPHVDAKRHSLLVFFCLYPCLAAKEDGKSTQYRP